jgi:hypothetical protein
MKKLSTEKATLLDPLATRHKISTINETLTADHKRLNGRKDEACN